LFASLVVMPIRSRISAAIELTSESTLSDPRGGVVVKRQRR